MAAGARFLALADRPSAVFCANDETAIGFISTLRAGGVECPRDVSVIGFDDIGMAKHFWPPLTTMRQPRETLGQAATSALIDILEGTAPTRGPLHLVLTSDLVVRASTARYRGGGVRPRRRKESAGL